MNKDLIEICTYLTDPGTSERLENR